MVDKTTTGVPKYWNNGQYVDAKQDNRGYYYIDDNGNRVDLKKPLLKFSSEPFEGIVENTKARIAKREEKIVLLEQAIEKYHVSYQVAQTKLTEYLATLGLKFGNEKQLTGIERSNVKKYEDAMSLSHRSTNLADMEIRGLLSSNFSDCCDLMKWA